MSWLSDKTGINIDLSGGDKPAAPVAPPPDPRLAQIRAEQQKQADAFSANAPKLKNDIYGDVQHAARANLAGQISDTRNNYNSRGLLFSGMRQGAELGAQANESRGLAQAKTKINDQVDSQAKQMQYNAIDSGLQAQKSQQAVQDQIYSNALSDFSARNNVLSSVFGAGGQIAGAALANRNRSA